MVGLVGLVFVDTLELTLRQHTAIIVNLAVCCFGYADFQPLHKNQFLRDTFLGGVCALALFYGFHGVSLTRDVQMLFSSAAALSRFTWEQYLTEFAHADYVKLQPPFVSFLLSRCPVYVYHQVLSALLICLGLPVLVDLYGRKSYLFAATPLYALVMIQPGTDVWLFWWIGLSAVCQQKRRLWLSALFYGAAFLVKPLCVLLLPVFLWRLRHRIILSFGVVFCYWFWSHETYWGIKQWTFLSEQVMVKHVSRGIVTEITSTWRPFLHDTVISLWKSLHWTMAWRWSHLGRPFIMAVWWYALPAYHIFLRPVFPLMVFIAILFGYGNIKYLIFAIFALPLQPYGMSLTLDRTNLMA